MLVLEIQLCAEDAGVMFQVSGRRECKALLQSEPELPSGQMWTSTPQLP